MITPENYLAKNARSDGILYYPGSGTDFGPLRLFAEHGACSTAIYVDFMTKPDAARNFLISIPGWTLDGPILPVESTDFNARSWRDFCPHPSKVKDLFSPESAFAIKARLRTMAGHAVTVLFFATEAHQTFSILIRAGLRPTVVVLQDHGMSVYWGPPFGGKSGLYKRTCSAHYFPDLLFVAENTDPWPSYERVTDFSIYEGQMHNHGRAIFQRTRR